MIESLCHLPINIKIVDKAFAVIEQRVGDLEEELITIKVSKDQAEFIGKFLMNSFKSPAKRSRVVAGQVSTLFGAFWSLYPRHENRALAEKIWNSKSCDQHFEQIRSHVSDSIEGRQWKEGFIPHASTYLNQRRWEDALENNSDNSYI